MKLPFTLSRPLAFFDLETTGLSTTSDRIIELALIRVSPQGDVLERVRRFNPGMPIPPDATAIHGITDEDVAVAQVDFVSCGVIAGGEGCAETDPERKPWI